MTDIEKEISQHLHRNRDPLGRPIKDAPQSLEWEPEEAPRPEVYIPPEPANHIPPEPIKPTLPAISNLTDEIISSRETTHGDYSEVARIAQAIKQIICGAKGYVNLSNPQRESVDLIATKLARICSGDPDFAEHWNDIAGYATLVANQCTK